MYSTTMTTLAVLITLLVITLSTSVKSSDDESAKKPQVHACYAPGTNLSDVLEAHNAHERYEFFSGRWSSTASGSINALGQPVILTWSFIPDGTMINGGYGEPSSPCNLQSTLLSLFGSQTAYMDMFNKAFSSWSSIAGIKFIYEPHDDSSTDLPGKLGVRGDIRIAGHRIDGDYGVLAYTSAPDSGDMVIDTADVYFSQNLDWMFQAIAHELGHALGLSHTCPMTSTKLMETLLATNYQGPQLDDILGIMSYYGDRLEPNDQQSQAADLGTVSGPKSTTTLSLHASTDQDFYRFTASATGTVTVLVQPTGQAYSTGAIGTGGGTGACGGTFPTVDTNRIYNLQLEIRDGTTGTLLATSNTGGLGAQESLTVTVTAGKSYVARVFTTSTAPTVGSVVQMYSVTLSSTGTPAASASRSRSMSPSHSYSPSRSRAATPSRSPSPSKAACGTSFCV